MACPTTVDPRAWNLLAGLALVTTGCGGRTASQDGSTSQDSSSSATTNETAETVETGDEDECVQDSDCPPGYYCLGGVCEYQIAPDGGPWYECYGLTDCGPLALCIGYACVEVPDIGGCEPTAEQVIPLPLAGEPLNLAFVDLDDDGAAELAVATQTELHVFDSGGGVPTVVAREVESPSVRSMVRGRFDPGAGEDLTVVGDGGVLIVHPADGAGSFASPSQTPSPLTSTVGVLAAQLDGAGPSDRLIWGFDGAGVLTGDGQLLPLTDNPIDVASIRATNADRLVLRFNENLGYYDLETGLTAEVAGTPSDDGEPLVSLVADGEHLELDAASFANADWTLLSLVDPQRQRAQWGVQGIVVGMVAGDIDGEGRDEVALLIDGVVWLLDNMASGTECSLPIDTGALGQATHLAVGDWDGDGDAELAIAGAGGVAVFDGG